MATSLHLFFPASTLTALLASLNATVIINHHLREKLEDSLMAMCFFFPLLEILQLLVFVVSLFYVSLVNMYPQNVTKDLTGT